MHGHGMVSVQQASQEYQHTPPKFVDVC